MRRSILLGLLLAGCGGASRGGSDGAARYDGLGNETSVAGSDREGAPVVAFYSHEGLRVLRGGRETRIAVEDATVDKAVDRTAERRARPVVAGRLAYVTGDFVGFEDDADGGATYLLNYRTRTVQRHARETAAYGDVAPGRRLVDGNRVIWKGPGLVEPVLEDLATRVRSAIPLPEATRLVDFAGDRLLIRRSADDRSSVCTTAGVRTADLEVPEEYVTTPRFVNARGEAFGRADRYASTGDIFGCARWDAAGQITAMPVPFSARPVGFASDGTALAEELSSTPVARPLVAWRADGTLRRPDVPYAVTDDRGDVPSLSPDGRTIVLALRAGWLGYQTYRDWQGHSGPL